MPTSRRSPASCRSLYGRFVLPDVCQRRGSDVVEVRHADIIAPRVVAQINWLRRGVVLLESVGGGGFFDDHDRLTGLWRRRRCCSSHHGIRTCRSWCCCAVPQAPPAGGRRGAVRAASERQPASPAGPVPTEAELSFRNDPDPVRSHSYALEGCFGGRARSAKLHVRCGCARRSGNVPVPVLGFSAAGGRCRF